MAAAAESFGGFEPGDIMGGLYGDGVIALTGAFPVEFADRLREDIAKLYEEARQVPGGALPRGPERFYVEVQPERIRGFVEIATHPWFVAVCESVLGPEYRIVEVGFDIPFPGAADQPWHRDFAVPEATTRGRRLNSLAFNLTAVDTTPEMGGFEIAPGTQWERGERFGHGMFPDRSAWPRYEALAQRKHPQMGDISA
ncbi:MAG: phytanoyl-CoA dioxygenase family protein, partial [Allosphingosinicella sp.]